jgi:hypothetical protein
MIPSSNVVATLTRQSADAAFSGSELLTSGNGANRLASTLVVASCRKELPLQSGVGYARQAN